MAGLPALRQWFLVRRAEKRLLPAAQAMWDHLARHGAEFLPALPGKAGPPAAPTALEWTAARRVPTHKTIQRRVQAGYFLPGLAFFSR